MRVSMKADYGLRALLDLAERKGGPPTPSHDVAARQQIPGPFLDQLLMTLRRAGLVRSTRGPRGGHVLAVAPEEITVAAAIEALEGQEMVAEEAPDTHEHSFAVTIHHVLVSADEAAFRVLQTATLADMVRDRQQRRVFHGIYHPLSAAPPAGPPPE